MLVPAEVPAPCCRMRPIFRIGREIGIAHSIQVDLLDVGLPLRKALRARSRVVHEVIDPVMPFREMKKLKSTVSAGVLVIEPLPRC